MTTKLKDSNWRKFRNWTAKRLWTQ